MKICHYSATRWTKRPSHRQGGVALIEALVGILIFAFGVLGLVGLQAAMTSAQSSAKFRGDAANLAGELVGVMLSDAPANFSRYTTANCESHPRCLDWQRKVASQLPGGGVALGYNAATFEIDIVISWTQGDAGTNSFSSTSRVQP
jgi:type IV pilus assembly protein PilV